VRLLLDTNALVWVVIGSRSVPRDIQRLLIDRKNAAYFSAVSIYEVAAKRASGAKSAPQIGAGELSRLATEAGYEILNMTAEHAIAVETLARYHPDPFDRMLLAQAQVEDMRLVTHDETLATYDSRTILF